MILEHVILLNGTLTETCLFQIITSYFRGFLLSVWILFLVKITCYCDQPTFDFDMFKYHQNNTNNMEEEPVEQLPSI